MSKKTVRIDVACRLYYVAEVDASLLEHGSGFLYHVLEQKALELLKSGKQKTNYYLSVMNTQQILSKEEREAGMTHPVSSESEPEPGKEKGEV